MTRFLLDTMVFLYAQGRDHPHREPCRDLLKTLQDGSLVGEASVHLVPEFAHVLRRRGLDGGSVRHRSLAVAALCRLHDFGEAELRLALNLASTIPALGMRDAVHAATALRRGASVVVTADKAFDEVPGLERLDPSDALARLLGSPPDPRSSS